MLIGILEINGQDIFRVWNFKKAYFVFYDKRNEENSNIESRLTSYGTYQYKKLEDVKNRVLLICNEEPV